MISYIKYLFCALEKLVKIEVEYSLVTKSGNTIHKISEIIKPKKLIIKKCKNWHKIVREMYGKDFDNKSKELLDKFIKKERKKIHKGWIDSGDYIVKCYWGGGWGLNIESDWINFEEYKEYIKNIKENG